MSVCYNKRVNTQETHSMTIIQTLTLNQLTANQQDKVYGLWELLQCYVPCATKRGLSSNAQTISNALLYISQSTKFNTGLVSKRFYDTGKPLSESTPEHFKSRKHIMMKYIVETFNISWTVEEFFLDLKYNIQWHGVTPSENISLKDYDMCLNWKNSYDKCGIQLIEYIKPSLR